MPVTDQRRQLADLLRETGSAHHQAYFATDGVDPDWPLGYAGYMLPRLNQMLGAALTRSELADLIVQVEQARLAASAPAAWPDYYADFFMGRHGGRAGHRPAAPQI